MGKIAGIDLGTTFSAVAYLNEMGRPEIIPNSDSERIMRSASYFRTADNVLIGQEAYNARGRYPDRTVTLIKKKMNDADYRVSIDGLDHSPADLSALILKRLSADARNHGGEVTDVVISIPANYGEVARKATMDAGTLAGLNVVGIVNEPTAAAIYYAITHQISGRVMIFDLGGGTFDISVADVKGKGIDIDIVTSGGDRDLGGTNFDEKLLNYFVDLYKKETGAELISDATDKAEIEDLAEDTKKALSKSKSTDFRLRGNGGTVRGELTRQKFESIISSDLARIEMLIEATLDEADIQPDEIEKVLLVGGSSRIPAVQNILKNIFGFEPISVGNVDECVCLGAAFYAGMRLMEEDPSKVGAGIASGLADVKVGEVCNHSYGTTCLGENDVMKKLTLQNDILIKKDSKIPCTVTKTYYTIHANQRSVRGNVTQGESSDPDYVTKIAESSLDLPPGVPEGSPIEISYSYDKDQRMSCSFVHKESGRKLVLNIDLESGTSSTETLEGKKARIEDFTIE